MSRSSQRQSSASRNSSSLSSKSSLAKRAARLSHQNAGSSTTSSNNNNNKSLGVDPQTLKQRVDSMYHRILRAEVDSRLQAETDRRQNLERELHARATRARNSRAEHPDPERLSRNRRQQSHSNDDDRTSNSSNGNGEPALSEFHSQQISSRVATANGTNQRKENTAAAAAAKRGKAASNYTSSRRAKERENAFQAHRHQSGARGRRTTGPIVRQFRHKHEIVRDAEVAQRQVTKARERLAAEQEKSKAVNAEHAEITEAVHASKQKIKALVSLIRSLALSRTQKLHVVSGSKQQSQQQHTTTTSSSSLSARGERDAAHIIDDHLDTILDLLPHYERKAQRVRRVVCDDVDEDPHHPTTIDDLLENVSVPGAGDVPISALVDEAPSKKAIQQKYEAYLQNVFDANAEANAMGIVDDEEQKTARALENERVALKARIVARQHQTKVVPASTRRSTTQQQRRQGQAVVGSDQQSRRVKSSTDDGPTGVQQFEAVVDNDEWRSALNYLSSGM